MLLWARILAVLMLTALIGVTDLARAQAPNYEGAARTASVMSAVVLFCGAYFLIDGPEAAKMSGAARELALQNAPGKSGRTLVNAEFKRRLQEVEITRAPNWCQNQREIQRNLGTGIFLN